MNARPPREKRLPTHSNAMSMRCGHNFDAGNCPYDPCWPHDVAEENDILRARITELEAGIAELRERAWDAERKGVELEAENARLKQIERDLIAFQSDYEDICPSAAHALARCKVERNEKKAVEAENARLVRFEVDAKRWLNFEAANWHKESSTYWALANVAKLIGVELES